MEQVKQEIHKVTESLRRSNQTPTSTTATDISITPEAEKTLGTIIFRTRLAKGWNGYDVRTQSMAVQTWFEILQTEKVPVNAFDELYRRACQKQAAALQNGREMPDMSAQLMLSCWIGEFGLRSEMRQREINSKKFLPSTAESICFRCDGTNLETVYSDTGENLGRRPNCKHQPLIPGEWLWKKAQENEKE